MPRYNYQCPMCDNVVELNAKVNEEYMVVPCKCQDLIDRIKYGILYKRIFSPSKNFILRGKGWAKDNYSKPEKKKEKEDKDVSDD